MAACHRAGNRDVTATAGVVCHGLADSRLSVERAEIALPDFGLPREEPTIPAATYETRVAAARQRAADAGYDVLIVYADREHFANLAYLTGFDPRFEEALLILAPGHPPTLLV